jgi:hypothetical protein
MSSSKSAHAAAIGVEWVGSAFGRNESGQFRVEDAPVGPDG